MISERFSLSGNDILQLFGLTQSIGLSVGALAEAKADPVGSSARCSRGRDFGYVEMTANHRKEESDFAVC